jgi:hypothetical protein
MTLANIRKNFENYGVPILCGKVNILQTKIFRCLLWVLLDGILDDFSKFRLIIGENCILICFFGYFSKIENYSMRWLSIRRHNFILC